jgi:two-component system chemotaxis response regulator CheY
MVNAGPKCVLIVDDDALIRQSVTDILEYEGYHVEQAANGEQGLLKVQATRPDAIVLDLMMPVMDGWAFLRACRADPQASTRPILLMSAHPLLPDTAREFYVEGFLAKPFDMYVLLEVVQRLVLLPDG